MDAAAKVQIPSLRKTKIVTLPSIEGSQVELFTTLLVADQRRIQERFPDSSALSEKQSSDMTMMMLTLSLRDWNLSDENGEKLPFSQETYDKLSVPDVLTMMEVVTGQTLMDASGRALSPDEVKAANAKKAKAS